MRSTFFVLLVIFVTLACAQVPPVFLGPPQLDSCIGGLTSCNGTADSTCSIFKYMPVVVRVSTSTSEQVWSYCLRVDTFYQVHLNGSYQWLRDMNDVNATVTVSTIGGNAMRPINESSSIYVLDERYIFDKNMTQYASFFGVILKLDQGRMNGSDSITFTTNCNEFNECLLAEGVCIRGKDCGWDDNESTEEIKDKDVKIFIGWDGTDRNDYVLTSKSYLPHQYRSFAIAGALTRAAQDAIDWILPNIIPT